MGSNTQILHDLRILITGVSTNERGSLVKLAKHQGAVLLSAATANDPPHVVMTRRVGTPKYVATMRHRPSTPVVTPEWLNASVSAGKRLPYADFAAGPFQGLIVCFSGLPVQEKNRLAALVTSRGGKHSPSLSTECTHLVTVSKESDKYRFAQRHGIACLRPDWFEETVAKGWCQEEKAYAVETEPICAGATSSGQAAAAGSKRLREASAMPLNDEQSCGWTGVSGGGESRMPELSSKSLDAAPSGAARLLPSRLGRDAIGGNIPNVDVRGDGRSAMDAPGPPTSSAAEPSPAPWAALDWDDSNPRFLDACYVWPVACSTGESIEIQSLCAQSGAKRFTSPHPDLITHVIVGSLMEPSEADNVVKFITEQKRSVVTVSIEWLRRSVARREVLPADERFAITVRPTTLKIAPVSTLATRPNDITLDADGSFHGLEAQLQPSLLRQLSGPPSLQGGGLLEGCYFTLAALKGRADEAVAERLIRAHGGRLFTTRSVPAGARAFAICPASLTPAAALTLRPSHPDFAAVPETNRFTVYWLECCGLAGEILVAQRGTPCFQPLPYDLPLPGMNRVSAAISGYDASVRAAIQRTLEIVGGRVSADFMTSRDSHLILPVARGEKYNACARLQVIPVTADWLVDSVHAGKLQSEGSYHPPPPVGQPASLPAFSKPTQAAFSQIAITQLPSAPRAPMAADALRPRPPSLRERMVKINAVVAAEGTSLTTRPLLGAKRDGKADPLKGGRAPPGKRPALDLSSLIVRNENPREQLGEPLPKSAAANIVGSFLIEKQWAPMQLGGQQQAAPKNQSSAEDHSVDVDLAAALSKVSNMLHRIGKSDKISHRGIVDPGSGLEGLIQLPVPPDTIAKHTAAGGGGNGNRLNRQRNPDEHVQQVRRSSRKPAETIESTEMTEFMSQRVGYEVAPTALPLPAVVTDVGASKAAKERLTRAGSRQKRGILEKESLAGF